MPNCYAVLYAVDYRDESSDDRLYRFPNRKRRTEFLSETYGDPAYPRSLPIKGEEAMARFAVKKEGWERDEYGEYILPRA